MKYSRDIIWGNIERKGELSMSYKEYLKKLKESLTRCKDMEERIHRRQKNLPPLLRLCLYLNVGIAVNHVANGHYVLAGYNLLVAVFCLEVNLYSYRKREETIGLLEEIDSRLELVDEIDKEIKGCH